MNFLKGARPARRLFHYSLFTIHYPLLIIHYLTVLSPFPR